MVAAGPASPMIGGGMRDQKVSGELAFHYMRLEAETLSRCIEVCQSTNTGGSVTLDRP
jgi:hypothetical protein